MTPADATDSRAIRDADLCVKCGLCLPHCPTYLDSRIEGDGPRGRIALIDALAAGTIAADPRLQGHLDGCLSCRACEAVCPAKVPYGRLIDHGRQLLARTEPRRTRLAALASWWLATRGRRRLFAWPLWLAQRLGLFMPLRHGVLGRRLARLATLLPPLPVPRRPRIGTPEAQGDRVLLFGGCVTELAERAVLEACARLLRAAGYAVTFPSAQGCCGAIAQHAGLAARAQQQARHNLRALAGDGAVAATTSGCAATLRDYADLVGSDGATLAARVHDVGHLLAARADRLRFAPLHEHVALHLPCTLRNVLREGDAMERLLHRVPGLRVTALDPAQRCCGAAGLHFIEQPDAADRLLEPKLECADALRPDRILSANVGCSLHLAGGLARRGIATPVEHPLSLLARQLMD